jgi:dTDP-4-amino-4,6-dideoxygalactose transaminase
MELIPYGRQSINNDDKKIVIKSLEANLITTGFYVTEFEKKLKKYFGTKYTLVCSSATAGLHLAFLSINVKKNDNIIIPAINFIASYNMLSTLGANIYLCDVDPKTGQMSPELIYECIKFNKLKKVKAIITMYLGGYPSNIVNFYKINVF